VTAKECGPFLFVAGDPKNADQTGPLVIVPGFMRRGWWPFFDDRRVLGCFQSRELLFPRFLLAERVIAGLRVKLMVVTRSRRLLFAANNQSRQRRKTMIATGTTDLSERLVQSRVVPSNIIVRGSRGGRLLDVRSDCRFDIAIFFSGFRVQSALS